MCRCRAGGSLQDLLELLAVEVLTGAAGEPLDRHHPKVGGDHPFGTVSILQGRDQLRADLAERASDQYPPHVRSTRPFGCVGSTAAPTVPKGCSMICLWAMCMPPFHPAVW